MADLSGMVLLLDEIVPQQGLLSGGEPRGHAGRRMRECVAHEDYALGGKLSRGPQT